MVKAYLVGGVVRDLLLGLPRGDVDIVVEGVSFGDAKAHWGNPVGKSFPVWRVNGMDVALTRTERKAGKGYNGFKVVDVGDVPISTDLARRDFTINALAYPIGEWGDIPSLHTLYHVGLVTTLFPLDRDKIIPPKGWNKTSVLSHLDARLLVPVSDSAFAEDPLRAVRAAKFASRGFIPSPEVFTLAASISDDDFKALPKHRLIQEFKGSKDPLKFLRVLGEMGLLWLYDVCRVPGVPTSCWQDHTFTLAVLSTHDWLSDVDAKAAKLKSLLVKLSMFDFEGDGAVFDLVYRYYSKTAIYPDIFNYFVCYAAFMGWLDRQQDISRVACGISKALYAIRSISAQDAMDLGGDKLSGKAFGDFLKSLRANFYKTLDRC